MEEPRLALPPKRNPRYDGDEFIEDVVDVTSSAKDDLENEIRDLRKASKESKFSR